jgi:acyl-CoA synthetase (AMP-forming)/AMP-acid ligase II
LTVSALPAPVGADQPRDLAELLARAALRDPAATSVIDIGADRRALPVTRQRLWRRTLSLAEWLAEHGVGPGDCVAVWLPNWSDALCWQFAAVLRGAHVIGVNTRYNVDEVGHVLDRARPRLVAVAHGFRGLPLARRLRAAVARCEAPTPAVAVVSGPGAAPPADLSGYDLGAGAFLPDLDRPRPGAPDRPEPGALDRPEPGALDPLDPDALGPLDPGAPGPLDPGRLDPDALAVAFTTSGSTGRPKLAAHRAGAVLAHALADAAALELAEDDVLLCAIPLAGTFGFSAALAALAAGATVLLEPEFDPPGVLADMATHRVSHVVGGDDLGSRLAEAWRAQPRELPAWRWWGAANFQGRLRELAQWAAAEFGTLTTGLYGSSEVFALAAMWPADEPAPRRWDGGGRIVGARARVRVVDPETGQPLPHGQEGELWFQGPSVVDAYLGNPADPLAEDGWFRSGDLGYLVEDGVFVYTCRMGDALRLRGFLVDPAEIELRLAEHPEVDTAKVVGVERPGEGTVAVGFVVPAEGAVPDPERLREWCAATLAKFKVPDAVHVIDEMPTTSGTNGSKIRAAELREWAKARAGR